MDTVRSVAASLCVTLIATGIFSMLLPNAGWNRFAKFGVRLFLLLSLVSPFLSGNIDWDLAAASYQPEADAVRSALSELSERQLLETFAANLEESARETLESAGIVPDKIAAAVHIADEQRIDITAIEITLPEGQRARAEEAAGLISETFGMQPQILFSGNLGGENGG